MMKSMEKSSGNGRAKMPVSVLLIMVAVLLVCLIAIILAINYYFQNQSDLAGYLLLFGIIVFAGATYSLLQVRRRVMRLKIEAPPITTTIECKKCGFKTVRAFQRGDYVFKEVEPCQKCNDKMMITAIYREISQKDKEKEKSSF
jgi:hypothetical protein